MCRAQWIDRSFGNPARRIACFQICCSSSPPGWMSGSVWSAASDDLFAGVARNFQVFGPLDFLAELTQHIPDQGEHLVRYYGYYSNKARLAPTTDESGHPRDIASLRRKDVSRVAKHAISLAKDFDKSVTDARTIAKKKLRTALDFSFEPITCPSRTVAYNYSEGGSNFFPMMNWPDGAQI